MSSNAENKTLITYTITNKMLKERKVIILPFELYKPGDEQKILLEIFQKSHILGITWSIHTIETPIDAVLGQLHPCKNCLMLKKTNE